MCLLSIIVPVYNVENYVQKCVQSILNNDSDWRDFEIILIDDGSTDRSGVICEELAKDNSLIKLIHRSNKGLSEARNLGLIMAKGKYVTFVDSDDYLADNRYLENVLIMEKDTEIDFLQYPTRWNVQTEGIPSVISSECIEGQDVILKNWWRGDFLNYSVCNKIFRRNLFDHLRFEKYVYFEDLHLVGHLVKLVHKVMISELGLYAYEYRENSVSANQKDYSYKKHYDLYVGHLNFLKELCSREALEEESPVAFLRIYRRLINAGVAARSWIKVKRELNDLMSYCPPMSLVKNSDLTYREKQEMFLINCWGINFYSWVQMLYLYFRSLL